VAKRTKGLSKAALAKLAPAHYTTLKAPMTAHPISFGLAPAPKEQDIAESINVVLASVASGESFPIAPEVITEFGVSVARKLQKALTAKTDKRKPYTLRMSEVGQPCLRRLWYSVNQPEDAAEHSPATLVRFLYGDILEDVVLALAKVAGNTVEGQQEELSFTVTAASGRVWTILGHRDALINGKEWDVNVWDETGNTTVIAFRFPIQDMQTDTLPTREFQRIITACENYRKGTGSCSACKTELKLTEIAGRYFAGIYCTKCWETKYRAIEAAETYE